jgi:uncharacterized LabA/DUF88 family protein
VFIQKDVDVLLAIDLVRLSSKGQIQKAFLVAGDADFSPVVKAAKDEGVMVKLFYSEGIQVTTGRQHKQYSDELWKECGEREAITKQIIDACPLRGPKQGFDIPDRCQLLVAAVQKTSTSRCDPVI